MDTLGVNTQESESLTKKRKLYSDPIDPQTVRSPSSQDITLVMDARFEQRLVPCPLFQNSAPRTSDSRYISAHLIRDHVDAGRRLPAALAANTHLVQHTIDTGDPKPIWQPSQRVPIRYRSEVDEVSLITPRGESQLSFPSTSENKPHPALTDSTPTISLDPG
ncbi:hypothetical protein SprV_0200536800 [Sparganum proliferum]